MVNRKQSFFKNSQLRNIFLLFQYKDGQISVENCSVYQHLYLNIQILLGWNTLFRQGWQGMKHRTYLKLDITIIRDKHNEKGKRNP